MPKKLVWGPFVGQYAADGTDVYAQGTLPIGVSTIYPASMPGQVSPLTAARSPVLQEISVGMSGEEAAAHTVSGAPPLSLPDSLGYPLMEWSVNLSPYQEGSGDPSPNNIRPIHGTDKINWFVEGSYDPSANPKAVINLPQTVYAGTVGSDGGESRWGYTVFNGTESWVASAQGFYCQFNALIRTNHYINSIMCDKLTVYDTFVTTSYLDATQGITGWVGSGYPGQNWIYAKGGGATGVTAFKAWLAENPITVVYELATPTTFAVPSVTIPTPRGSATAWATAEDGTVDSMSVTYVGKA